MKEEEESKGGTAQFLQAAYPNEVSVQNSGGLMMQSNLKGVSRIEVRHADHTIRNTLIVVFTVIVILLCLDVRMAIGH